MKEIYIFLKINWPCAAKGKYKNGSQTFYFHHASRLEEIKCWILLFGYADMLSLRSMLQWFPMPSKEKVNTKLISLAAKFSCSLVVALYTTVLKT